MYHLIGTVKTVSPFFMPSNDYKIKLLLAFLNFAIVKKELKLIEQ